MASSFPSRIFNSDFCLQIAKHIGMEEIGKGLNFVFSPLSVYTVLSMVSAGSGGSTLEQMLSYLKVRSIQELNMLSSHLIHLMTDDGPPNVGPVLSLVNGVWAEQSIPLKPTFKDVMNHVYKAEARAVDFRHKADEVLNQVNSWAESYTNGLIKDLLPPGSLNSSTLLVLANAIYFKGTWDTKFDVARTRDREFYLLNGSTIKAPFMTSTKAMHVLRSFDEFKVLKLPYQQGQDKKRLSMYFILPHKKGGLPNLIEKFNIDSSFLDRYLHLWEVEAGQVRLPRFKISFGFEASRIMTQLGLTEPFSGRLTEMVEQPGVSISEIHHKSFVEVNEEGTEAAAAAATAAITAYNCAGPRPTPISFVADRPFMFMIREEVSGAVLFIGNVLDPSKSG